MKRFLPNILLLLLSSIAQNNYAASIILHTKNATAWLPQQTIKGELADFKTTSVTIHHNDSAFVIEVKDGVYFSCSLTLHNERNKIWVEALNESETIVSDTVEFTLGYKPLPVIKSFAVIESTTAIFHACIIENPFQKPLKFYWYDDPQNPAPVKIKNAHDSVAASIIPGIDGTYYFNLLVTAGKDSAWFKTYVTRNGNALHAFNLDTEYAAWINEAIVYEVTPYIFVKDGKYNDITAKLPELKKLGVNTIWLQPVFKNHDNEQGYGVTDYFVLRTDLGTEQQLHQLISTAKNLQMRVLFDIVPNHSSIYHPYAEDAVRYGTDSHYYNFYQHGNDGASYSSNYHKDAFGFIYYFWKDLVNLNFDNPEVQQWMIEACKYWIRKFDIDGYRFDAVWGVNARMPSFAKRLRLELKSIKPELMLLAEDKGALLQPYKNGFDVAYDWTADTGWISQWSWQTDYAPKLNPTIFNFPQVNERGMLLREALFTGENLTQLKLRFIENNDVARFIEAHGIKRTKMVAALEFTLPGIPMIYNGQEIGSRTILYSDEAIFIRNKSIRALDHDSLFPYYQKLISIRKKYKSLHNSFIKEIPVSPDKTIVAFNRKNDKENFIVIINLSGDPKIVSVNLKKVITKDNFYLTDVLTNKLLTYKNTDLSHVQIPIDGYTCRLLLIHQNKFSSGLIR
jgi:cyclomaltodextrinase